MNDLSRSALAELIGTFTLVFIGAGAGMMADSGAGGGVLSVAIAHGFALLVIVYAWGSVSGAHVNPAVTLGIALTGRMPWPKAVAYWLAQCIGGIGAALLLRFLVTGNGPEFPLYNTSAMLTLGSLSEAAPVKAAILEAVMTFFLLLAVFASGVGARSGNAAGLAIGFVLTMDILVGGPLTGASMNPARTLGPALATGQFDALWVYLIGPFVGAAAGAFLYDRLYLPQADLPPVEAAERHSQPRR